MFSIEMTINGKPLNEANMKDELEKAAFQSVVESAKESVMAVITEEEAAQITIDVVGTDLNNLSLKIDGPDEITKKIKNALSDE